MARPTKLTPDLSENLVQLVRAGMFLKDAAEYLGIARQTVYNWIERGEEEESRVESGEPPDEDEQVYVEFLDAISRSRAFANITDMNVIGQAAKDDPAWAERRLKLRNPSMFRTQIGLEVSRPSVEERQSLKRAGYADQALRNTRSQRIGGPR